jgi:hypothetical protein
MELKGSLPYSQKSVIDLYPESDKFSPCLPTLFLQDPF